MVSFIIRIVLLYLESYGDPTVNISCNKLFKLLIDCGMKRQDLQKVEGISSASVSRLTKNKCVRTGVLIKICLSLDIDFCGIMGIIK